MSDGQGLPPRGQDADPFADPASVGEDEELAALLRAEIAARGPITFARFMERALYEPGHGYYRRAAAGPGREGDFLTAPEAHPIFGMAIGRLLEQAWEAMGRPNPFTISEPGAGSGALAAGLLGGLRDAGSPFLDAVGYRPVEVEAVRLDALRARLTADGLADRLTPATGAPAEIPTGDASETGAVVANEVLDALPVHRVIGRAGGLRELLVDDVGGRFVAVESDATDPRLAERLATEAVTLEEGQVTEVCLEIDDWLAGATRHLARGPVVLVDYAEEPDTLHAPRRRDGTLRAFARHTVSGDPFRHLGRQDLTATVDLAAVRAAAARAGLDSLGETTQAELLATVGTGELLATILRRPGASLQDALLLRSAVARLMDPRGMGGFRVLVFGRAMPPGTELPALRRLAPHRG